MKAMFLFLGSLFLCSTGLADGNAPLTVVERAKEAADSGRIPEAFSLLKKLQQSGNDSAGLAYNIGVLAVELREYGTAVLELRRAARAYPLHTLYLSQLAIARNMSGSAMDLKVPIDIDFSSGGIRISALIAAFLVVIAWRTQWRWLIVVLAILPWTILGISEYSLVRHDLLDSEIVTQSEKTEAYSSSQPDAQAVEVVSAGTELKILQEEAGWYFVKLPSGRKGWVKELVGALDP